MTTYIGIAVFCVFLLIYFGFTQKLYHGKYQQISLLFLLFLMISLAAFIWIPYSSKQIKLMLLFPMVCYYCIVLAIIKLIYPHCNRFLVSIKLIKQKFSQKHFTFNYVFGSSVVWDRKRADEPSWLDLLFSILLILIPLLMVVFSINFF